MTALEGAFRGRLKALSLADILEFLRGLNRRGLLTVSSQGTTIGLYLSGRHVVHITSTRPADRLGEFLLRRGLIARAQHEQAVRLATQGQRLGRTLIGTGALTPRTLMEARLQQAREIALSLFEWDEGEFVFLEGEPPGEEGIAADLPLLDLVVEGIRSLRRLSLFRERMPSPDWVFEAIPQAPDAPPVLLEPHEEYVLRLVDGERSIGAIVEKSDFGDLETLRILFLLFTLGRLKTRARERAAEGEAEDGDSIEEILERSNRMLARVYQHLMREVGPIARDLVAKSLLQMKAAHPLLFTRVALGGDGGLDTAALHENLRGLPAVARRETLVQGLNELLYAELLVLRVTLGTEHEGRVLRAFREESQPVGSAPRSLP